MILGAVLGQCLALSFGVEVRWCFLPAPRSASAFALAALGSSLGDAGDLDARAWDALRDTDARAERRVTLLTRARPAARLPTHQLPASANRQVVSAASPRHS